MRRLLRMKPRALVVDVTPGGMTLAGGRVHAIVSVNPQADLEHKVAFLLRRDQEQQEQIATLDERLDDLEEASAKQITDLREWAESNLSSALKQAAAENRTIRVVGAIALAIGLGLATAGNFA
jgi:hypothetical protein